MEKVVLFGTGQIATTAYSYLTHDSPYEVVAFAVDNKEIKQDTLLDLPIVPFEKIETFYPPAEHKMLIAIGYLGVNKLRAERYCQAKAKGYEFISYISTKATISPDATIGNNCIIGENSVIQPYAQIGDNVIIGSYTLIGHHVIIKDHCFLAAGAIILGGVTIEPYCFLGGNSTVRNGIIIAQECVISAGALILEDTKEREVYLGRSADRLSISSNELPLR